MSSDSLIICPDCGTQITVPPLTIPPSKCHKCSNNFSGYSKCSLCNNFTKKSICEFCGYNQITKQLTYQCMTCREPIRKDSSACDICIDWPKSLKNIIKSIFAFSDLKNEGLIKREQFEAKIIDIVEGGVSNNIPVNVVKDYLSIFVKLLDNKHIDENIYDKISDMLLARCKVSEKPQESLNKKIEKAPKITRNDNSISELNVDGALVNEEVRPDKRQPSEEAGLPSKEMMSSLEDRQRYFDKGLKLIKLFQHDEGLKQITVAAKMGHSQARRYLKDISLGGKVNYLSKQKRKAREIGETESYLKSRKIEKPPDTYHHDKADVPSKDQTKKGTMGVGVKIILSIVAVFVGSVVMSLIKEFQGFGILHGLAGIGTVWVIYYIWTR